MTLNSEDPSTPILVLGGASIGVAVVERVLHDHDTVLFLDPDPKAVETATTMGATAEVVEIASGHALEAALPDVDTVDLAIVAAEPDTTALLVGQLAKTKLDARTVLVLMHDPQNRVAFETAGMIPICGTITLADAVAATLSLVLLCGPDVPLRTTVPARTAEPSRQRGPR